MSVIAQFTNAYDRRARLYPMLVALFPLVFALGALLPSEAKLGPIAGSVVMTVALAALLAQLARDRGKRIEQRLFAAWGGRPTELALSYCGGVTNARTLKRLHDTLRSLDVQLHLPEDAASEDAQREQARVSYESATDLLITKTRDKTAFPLVFEENVNYGYRRNLLGLKPIGIICAVTGALFGIARMWWIHHARDVIDLYAVSSVLAAIALIAIWSFCIKPDWVRTAAEAYARQLVIAGEQLRA